MSTHGAFSHGSAVGTAPFSCRRCFFLRKHPRQPCRCFQRPRRCEGHDLQGDGTGDSRKSNPRVLPSLLAPAKPPLVPNPGSQTQAALWGQPLQTPPLWPLSPLSARIIKLPFFNPKWKQADGCAVPQIPQIRGGILHRAKDLSLMKTQSPVGGHKVPPAPEGTQLWSWPQFWG